MTARLGAIRNRRDHAYAQGQMSAYVDGELDGPQAGRVARHAGDCPECGPLLRSLTRLVDELRDLGARRERPSVVPRVLARLHGGDSAEQAPDA